MTRVCGIEAFSDARLREEITRGLRSLMDWNDEGPLAPGDIALFASDGAEHQAGYPYGAAGIIDQLRRSPAGIDRHTADAWLAARTDDIHSRGLRGREGLAHAARDADLGQTLTALESASGSEPTDPTLWSGWAGVGLYQPRIR